MMAVVIDPERKELSFGVKVAPEYFLVHQFFPHGSDHAASKGIKNRDARHRLDRLNVEDARVGAPAMKWKPAIMVGAEMLLQPSRWPCKVEHPADCRTIHVATVKGKADQTSAEHVDDEYHAVTLQHCNSPT